MRLFVAIFPPDAVIASLRQLHAGMEKQFAPRSIRWTRRDQIHLTLNFLGAIAAERVPAIESVLRAGCAGHRPHQVRVAGLGCFPNPSRPRILWAGLDGELQFLQNLKSAIDTALATCGCVPEDRSFQPHLTIGRIADMEGKDRHTLADILAREERHTFGDWPVERVDLMQSTLTPKGSIYTVLQSTRLERSKE